MRKEQLLISLIALSAALLLLPAFWFSYPLFEGFFSPIKAANELEVDFLDVGQGDSALIRTPDGQNVIIDGGPGRAVIKELDGILPFWDRTIDLMVLTHPHDDHVSGLIEVLRRYTVKKVLFTGISHTGPNYLAWLKMIREQDIPVVLADRLQTITLGEDCRMDLLYPVEDLSEQDVELNNSSIVLKLVYKNQRFLFTGDIEDRVEREFLDTSINLKADVLKVAHHGSDTSSLPEFLAIVHPEFAVISVGEDNSFGHPSLRVLKRLEDVGARIFRTDIDGTVRFISNGDDIWLK